MTTSDSKSSIVRPALLKPAAKKSQVEGACILPIMVPLTSTSIWQYKAMLREKIVNFDLGMFEQNVIAYLVMQQPDLLKHIHFEGTYCINCWYKDAFQSHIPQPPFVVHYAGCQMCNGFHPEKLNDCERDLVKTYLDSHLQLREIVASKARSLPASQRRAKQSI